MSTVDGKNIGNVVGGYKATIHNPRVSDEAKEHAASKLEELGAEVPADGPAASKKSSTTTNQVTDEDEFDDDDTSGNTNRVKGGYKATLKNPNVSEEAKERAQEYLETH